MHPPSQAIAPNGANSEAQPAADASRLAEIAALIDSGRFDALSLDVFDTLVWRSVPRPLDVFIRVAERLRDAGALHASATDAAFAFERQQAERRVRERTPGHEPPLAAILADMPAGLFERVSTADLLRAELEVERECVRPNPGIRALAARARERGMRLVLVSDTYCASADLRAFTGVDADVVLASNEHRCCKALGLHAVLLQRTGIRPERVLHVGDDWTADVEGPRALGIQTYWYPKWPEHFAAAIERELPGTLSARVPLVRAGDAGLTSLRGRAMAGAGDDEAEAWGAGVLGPVLSGFGRWVDARCEALGAPLALCLMREGRLLRAVLEARGARVTARELYVSRVSVLRAAILDGTADEILAFLSRPSAQRAGDLLAQLGLSEDALSGVDPDARLLPREVRRLAAQLSRDAALRRQVVAQSRSARRRLLMHFDRVLEGRRRGTIAVVDLGYKGTIQAALHRILSRERPGIRLHGLYLVTSSAVSQTLAEGCRCEGWLADHGQPASVAHTVVRSPEFIEQCLLADIGSTRGHDDQGEPVLDAIHVPREQREVVRRIQSGVLRWTRAWRAHALELGDLAPDSEREFARAILVRAVARPCDAELRLFADWKHDENFGSSHVRTLAEPAGLHAWERAHLSVHQLASLESKQLYWPFGYAWRQSQAAGEAVAAVYLREALPRAFHGPEPPRPIVFYWDDGAGFRAERAQAETFVTNGAGRVWARFRLRVRGADHHGYAVSLGSPGDWLAFTGARVHITPADGARRTLEFGHDALEMSGFQQVAPGLYAPRADAPLVRMPDPGLRAFVGSVDVDVFFTCLPEPLR